MVTPHRVPEIVRSGYNYSRLHQTQLQPSSCPPGSTDSRHGTDYPRRNAHTLPVYGKQFCNNLRPSLFQHFPFNLNFDKMSVLFQLGYHLYPYPLSPPTVMVGILPTPLNGQMWPDGQAPKYVGGFALQIPASCFEVSESTVTGSCGGNDHLSARPGGVTVSTPRPNHPVGSQTMVQPMGNLMSVECFRLEPSQAIPSPCFDSQGNYAPPHG